MKVEELKDTGSQMPDCDFSEATLRMTVGLPMGACWFVERRLTPSEVSKPREDKARASDFSDTGAMVGEGRR